MTCDPLAYSGPGANVSLLVILAVVFLVVGGVILLWTGRRGRIASGVLLLLISAAAVTITAGTPGRALAATDCPSADNSLTIVQTSVMDDLAPGTAPVPIAGMVRNNGADSTYIEAVDVRITRVVPAPGAVPGLCDASDYLLVRSLMPVGRTLVPGGSTEFSGASIGLRNKSVNQDTCKGARIELLYTANPS